MINTNLKKQLFYLSVKSTSLPITINSKLSSLLGVWISYEFKKVRTCEIMYWTQSIIIILSYIILYKV